MWFDIRAQTNASAGTGEAQIFVKEGSSVDREAPQIMSAGGTYRMELKVSVVFFVSLDLHSLLVVKLALSVWCRCCSLKACAIATDGSFEMVPFANLEDERVGTLFDDTTMELEQMIKHRGRFLCQLNSLSGFCKQ